MASGNGLDRAARRRIERNTPAASGLGHAEDSLAKVIGESVALHLGQLLGQVLPQVAVQPACVVCAMVRKQAELAWRAQVEAVVAGYRAAVENAKAAAEEQPPEPELPAQPALPDVQQSCTWVPIVLRPDLVPQPLPVCYDHMPATAEQAGLPPQQRETGLVFPDGRPIVARGG